MLLMKDLGGRQVTDAVSLIQLTFAGTGWEQAVYQFSFVLLKTWKYHTEFATPQTRSAEEKGRHQWVEEVMCHAASQHVLLNIGKLQTWFNAPPINFQKYITDHIQKARENVKGEDFSTMLEKLEKNEHQNQRAAYEVVASELFLPLLNKMPIGWLAICFIQDAAAQLDAPDLDSFLDLWQRSSLRVPEAAEFIGALRQHFKELK